MLISRAFGHAYICGRMAPLCFQPLRCRQKNKTNQTAELLAVRSACNHTICGDVTSVWRSRLCFCLRGGGGTASSSFEFQSCKKKEYFPLPPPLPVWFVDFSAVCLQWASSSVFVTNTSLVYFRIFDEVMSCFCDSPPQSPTFPEAGHASLYDEDKVQYFFSLEVALGLEMDGVQNAAMTAGEILFTCWSAGSRS